MECTIHEYDSHNLGAGIMSAFDIQGSGGANGGGHNRTVYLMTQSQMVYDKTTFWGLYGKTANHFLVISRTMGSACLKLPGLKGSGSV